MKYHTSIIAVGIALMLSLAGVTYAADSGGGQGGMQPGTSSGSLGNQDSGTSGSSPGISESPAPQKKSKRSGESSLGVEKDQKQTEQSLPGTTTGKQGTEGGDRFGESGSGQGSGSGSQSQSGSGMGNR
jgi:hypothetical protein